MKKLSTKYLFHLALFFIMAFVVFVLSNQPNQLNNLNNKHPQVKKGEINLEHWDFKEKGMVKLDWTNDFNKGTAPTSNTDTYRLIIKNLDKDQIFGFNIHRIYTNYKLWINGNLAAEKVVFSTAKKGEIELIFQVKNNGFYKAGTVDTIEMGTQKQIIQDSESEMIYISFWIGIICIMSLYHFILYFFWRKDPTPLYFGLFGFLILLQILFGEEMFFSYLFPFINTKVSEMIELIGLFLIGPIFISYLYHLFERKFSVKFLYFLWVFTALFSAALFFAPLQYYGIIWKISLPIIPLTAVYMVYFMIKNIQITNKLAFVTVSSIYFIALSTVRHILIDIELISGSHRFHLGWVFVLFLQFVVTAKKLSTSYTRIDNLSKDLSISNKKLELSCIEMKKQIILQTKALKESAERYKHLVDAAFEGIILHDKGTIVEVNKRICKMLKYKPKDLIGKSIFDFILPEHHILVKENNKLHNKNPYEIAIIKKDGSLLYVEISSKNFFFNDSTVGLVAIHDLTEYKKTEMALRENLLFLQTLLESIPNPIFYKDKNGIYIGCNTAFIEFSGYKKEEIIGYTVYDINPEEFADIHYKADMELLTNKGKQVYETKFETFEGIQRDVILTKATFVNAKNEVAGLIGVITDITARKEMEENLKIISTTDHLTKLCNRIKFNQALNDEINRVKRYHNDLSIIMFDIDHFKKVNDNFGHPVGDEILITLSALVKSMARNTDIVARWGGEEFIILTKDTDIKGAAMLAERIREKIQEHHFEKVNSITCSFGVTGFLENDDMNTLILRADTALYKAKNTGRNRVVAVEQDTDIEFK